MVLSKADKYFFMSSLKIRLSILNGAGNVGCRGKSKYIFSSVFLAKFSESSRSAPNGRIPAKALRDYHQWTTGKYLIRRSAQKTAIP